MNIILHVYVQTNVVFDALFYPRERHPPPPFPNMGLVHFSVSDNTTENGYQNIYRCTTEG